VEFNIEDDRNAKKGSTKEFRVYRRISSPRVDQKVVLVREPEKDTIIVNIWPKPHIITKM